MKIWHDSYGRGQLALAYLTSQFTYKGQKGRHKAFTFPICQDRCRLLDRHDHSPVGHKKINKRTGEVLEKDDIVKGYEFSKDQYVVMTEEDFEVGLPKSTHMVDIEDVVNIEELDLLLFDKPYYLDPEQRSLKSYKLLRESLRGTQKAAIGRIVLCSKQHLAAILPRGDY